jgi:hypothetical protein
MKPKDIVLAWLALVAAATAGAAELTVFSRGIHRNIALADRPEPREAVREVELWAFRGEYEPFTFAVHHAGKHDARVTARPTPLIHRLGNRAPLIPAARVEVRGLRRGAKLRWRRTTDWVLDAPGTATAAPGRNACFWGTVHVPENAEPGRYEGALTIVDGTRSAEVRLVLHVSRATLPDVPGVGFYLLGTVSPYGQYHRALKPARVRQLRPQVEAFYREFRAHGMTGICPKTSDFPYQEGRIDGLIAEVSAALKAGLRGPVVWNMLALIDAAKGGDRYDRNGRMDRWDPKRGLARLRRLHALATAEAKKRGWPELVFYPIDEPGTQYENRTFLYRSMDILLQTTRELHRLGARSHSTLTEPVDDKHNRAPRWSRTPDEMRRLWDTCRPTLSIRNYGYGYPQGKTNLAHEIKDARSRDHEIWTYHNPAVMGHDRACARLYFGLWGWKARLDGVTAWTYPGGRTVQFEMVREGIDDHKALALLERLIEDGRGDPADRRRARAFLAQLRQSIPIDRNGFIPDWGAAARAVRLDSLKERVWSLVNPLAP